MKKLLKIILFENCFGLKLVSFILGHLGLNSRVDSSCPIERVKLLIDVDN